MHGLYFHPQVQNSSFILQIDSAVGYVLSMNTVKGKIFFSSSYQCFGAMDLTQFLVEDTGVHLRENGGRHVALTTLPHQAHC